MKVASVKAGSIISRSNIPGIDFVANPYVGCQHGCIYCYAEFMKRFTNHAGDIWGEFLDVKQFELDKIRPEKYDGKTLLLSSVTDPYTPLEVKYENTRRILRQLIGTKADIQVLTKSKLVERDADLFEQFERIEVGVSLNTLDNELAGIIEPRASRPADRLNALRRIADKGISTYVFVSPIFPRVSDWKKVIETASRITDDFRFENLNFRGHNIPRIMKLIDSKYPALSDYYRRIRMDQSLWNEVAESIETECKNAGVKCRIEFHHGGFSKD